MANPSDFTYQIKVTNVQTSQNIRKTLSEHIYTDKATDLPHKLTFAEVDALCAYFDSCKTDDDCDEFYLHTVADNVIRTRLREERKAKKK